MSPQPGNPFYNRRLVLAGIVVLSQFVGMYMGFVSATAEMMGQAEAFPKDALPEPPNPLVWIAIGGCAGLALGVVSVLLFRATQSYLFHYTSGSGTSTRTNGGTVV